MADLFLDRIAQLAGKTSRTLKQVAEDLEGLGLASHASTLKQISSLHEKIAYDCMAETQPIAMKRYDLRERMIKTIDEISEISEELSQGGNPGHEELEEAVGLLLQALGRQGK